MSILTLVGRQLGFSSKRFRSYVIAEMIDGKLVEAVLPHQNQPMNLKGETIFFQKFSIILFYVKNDP
jgi:hypothetical protein